MDDAEAVALQLRIAVPATVMHVFEGKPSMMQAIAVALSAEEEEEGESPGEAKFRLPRLDEVLQMVPDEPTSYR